jgi:hypothetical protein|uniref:Uncharacterized protein n=1 Tax=uncultured Caudovirales phage TaxID=2100421 RepID=A0A6J5L2T1_9CAUD|nr:hypothetical protein UFOVP88_2 [uncultured Caudovirales phage]
MQPINTTPTENQEPISSSPLWEYEEQEPILDEEIDELLEEVKENFIGNENSINKK